MTKTAKRNRTNQGRKMLLESLEGRRMFDATGILDVSEPEVRAQVTPSEVRLVDGTLRIDAIVNAQNVSVTANGDKVTVASKGFGSMADVSFDRSEVVDILFNGSEGDDIFVNETDIDSIAFGRGGNDRLVGGSGNDDLFGGAGNDRLYGRGGVDLLLGGEGVDRLFEDDGSDLTTNNQSPSAPVQPTIPDLIVEPSTKLVKVNSNVSTRSIYIQQGQEVQIDLSGYDVKSVRIAADDPSLVGAIAQDSNNDRLFTFKPVAGFVGTVELVVTHIETKSMNLSDLRDLSRPVLDSIYFEPIPSRQILKLPQISRFVVGVNVTPIQKAITATATTATTESVKIDDEQANDVAIRDLPAWLCGTAAINNAALKQTNSLTDDSVEKVETSDPLRPDVVIAVEQDSITDRTSIPFVPEVVVAPTNPLRPTLLVLTQGANFNFAGNEAGHGTFDWQTNLQKNLTRDLEAAGSEVFTMQVQWNSLASNENAVKDVAGKIREFLSNRQTQWDVVLVGHSRGGVFSHDLTRALGEPANMNRLQLVMLDPTAAISMGDSYPQAINSNVDNAVVYDDGFQLFPMGLVKDSTRVAGADYERVELSGLGYYDPGSHEALANQYAKEGYKKDLAWLLSSKQPDRGQFADEIDAANNWEAIVAASPANHENIVNVGFDPNNNGNAQANVNVIGVGGASVSVGKDGLQVAAGATMVGSASVSVSERGVGVSVVSGGVGPLNVGGGVFIGEGNANLDVDLGPIHIGLGTDGGGITVFGEHIELPDEEVVTALEDALKDTRDAVDDAAKVAEETAKKASEEAAKQEKIVREEAAKAAAKAAEVAKQQAAQAAAQALAAKKAAEQAAARAREVARQAAERAAKAAADAVKRAAEQAKKLIPKAPKIKKFW